MHVVHVVQRFHPDRGGTETHVRMVAREQVRRGHQVTVVTSATRGAPSDATDEGIRVLRLAARQRPGEYLWPPWLVMPRLVATLRGLDADLLHAHAYRFHTIEGAADASRVTRTPLVVTAHGFYPPENALVALARARYDALRGRRALAQASRVVAVTEHERAHYAALGVDPGRIDVVPNGVDEAAFRPGDAAAFRTAHDVPKDAPTVLFLARLAHDKGLLDLVRAWPRVLADVPDARLLVAGRDAGAEAKARRLAGEAGLGARVHFLGGIPEPRDAYAACDVFVLPSHYEAFGIVLLEAMAQARPVVATTAGGMPEVVGDAGRLVPPGAPAPLAATLARLLRDPKERALLAARGPARARSFLWTDVVARLEETYDRARGP